MSSKIVCKYEKYGYCKLKRDCKDYHPTEVCKEPVCNVAKCVKRHPQPCRYQKAGSCKFKEHCKYDHEDQINTKELLEKKRKLENEKILALDYLILKTIIKIKTNLKMKPMLIKI